MSCCHRRTRFRRRGCHRDAIAVFSEERRKQHAQSSVVVDDEDVRSIVVGRDLRRDHTSLRRRRAMSLGRRPPRADQLQDPLAVRGLDHREQERDGVVFTKRAQAFRGA